MSNVNPDPKPAAPAEPSSDPAAPSPDDLPEHDVHDIRAGGDASHAPRSLAESEAHWQEHESSGASWDEPESI